MFLNILVTLVISTFSMASYQKQMIKLVESIFKSINPNEVKNIYKIQTHITASTWLIIISGIVLTIGFTAIFFFQSKSSYFPTYIQTFISSGLYIPVFLFFIGFIIRLSYKIYIKKSSNSSLSISEIKTIVFIMTIIISFTLITLDWQLCLFVFAIILGKFVWIDSVFDTKSLTKVIVNAFKKSKDLGIEFLCFEYAKIFYPIFIVPVIIYQLYIKNISDLSTKLICCVAIYINYFYIYKLYAHRINFLHRT